MLRWTSPLNVTPTGLTSCWVDGGSCKCHNVSIIIRSRVALIGITCHLTYGTSRPASKPQAGNRYLPTVAEHCPNANILIQPTLSDPKDGHDKHRLLPEDSPDSTYYRACQARAGYLHHLPAEHRPYRYHLHSRHLQSIMAPQPMFRGFVASYNITPATCLSMLILPWHYRRPLPLPC